MHRFFRILFVLVLAGYALAAAGQVTSTAGTAAIADQAPPDTADNSLEGLRTPRETMETFMVSMRLQKDGTIGAWREAARAFDLDEVPMIAYDEAAYAAAFGMHEIINRLEWVVYETIPNDPNFDSGRYIYKRVDGILIEMTRSDAGAWRFSKNTVEAIPSMLEVVRNRNLVEGAQQTTFIISPEVWLRTNLPHWFFQRAFILENFQWMAILFFILLGFIVDRLLRIVLQNGRTRLAEARGIKLDEEPFVLGARRLGLASSGLVWLLGLTFLHLPEQLTVVLTFAVVLYTAFTAIAAGMSVIDVLAGLFLRRAALTDTKYDDVLVPLIQKSAKVFVVAIGVIFIADNMEIDITSLLAGLGIGGLALALAAKDTLENLFGSITVLVDRPFNIGDWVIVEGVEGTVETVGLRSTRIRTFYNSLITVPNSNLIKASVDNMGARRYRRVKTMISVTYNTPPEKIDAFCEGIREIIRRHPYTRKDYYHVWFNQFNSSSLDILVYAFHEVPDWATELRERHRLFLDIVRLAHRLGIEFAFPTQTLYLERGTGPAQPDPSPFGTRREMMDGRAQARDHVSELASRMLHDGTESFPPPPVKFNVPMDPEEMALRPENRGGDGEE